MAGGAMIPADGSRRSLLRRQPGHSRLPGGGATERAAAVMSQLRQSSVSGEIRLRESQVEDILATYPDVARRLVGSDVAFRLIGRQLSLSAGRLDLLWSTGPRLLL